MSINNITLLLNLSFSRISCWITWMLLIFIWYHYVLNLKFFSCCSFYRPGTCNSNLLGKMLYFYFIKQSMLSWWCKSYKLRNWAADHEAGNVRNVIVLFPYSQIIPLISDLGHCQGSEHFVTLWWDFVLSLLDHSKKLGFSKEAGRLFYLLRVCGVSVAMECSGKSRSLCSSRITSSPHQWISRNKSTVFKSFTICWK